jgi:hypothetical protein
VWDTKTETGKWIAMEGSSVDYGAICVDQDYFDPEDGDLFATDDEADSEGYEGYTGNAGALLHSLLLLPPLLSLLL